MSKLPPKNSTVAVYVRVSTLDQEKGLASQEKAIASYLAGHGFEGATFYRDRLSAKDTRRPAFQRLQKDIFAGRIRTVVCWKLDRLSRSMRDGINVLTDWLEQGIRVVSVSQQFDFAGASGKLIAAVLFAVAEMERENLRENTKRGMAAAKAKGVRLGKRPKLFAKDILPLLEQGQSIASVAKTMGVSRQAIYDALSREGIALADITRSNPTRKEDQ